MDRPVGITIISILQGILGFYLALTAAMWLGLNLFGAIFYSPTNSGVRIVVSIAGLILGLMLFYLAFAFSSEKVWAWKVTLILQFLVIARELLSLIFGGTPVGIGAILISAVIIFYLYRPEIKSRFA